MLRVQAVLPAAVAGHRTGRCGKGHQGADRRIHLRQAGRAGAEAARKRVVAAGVQNHDVGAIAGSFHLVQHGLGVHGGIGHLVLAFDRRSHRDQVVAALDLHAVAGVVKQARATATQAVAKLAQRCQHAALVQVLARDHGKAGLPQGLRHGAGIIHRVGQRRLLVAAIADHQGHALA